MTVFGTTHTRARGANWRRNSAQPSDNAITAELAARMPDVGGQYAYLRESYHPAVAFLYGWVLLLVIQTGGMAAVSITFARYFLDLAGKLGC